MAVNREVQAFQDPLWGAFLGPAFLSLHLGFPEGRKRQCWVEGGNTGSVCLAFVEAEGKIHPVPQAAFLREQGMPGQPRRASLA